MSPYRDKCTAVPRKSKGTRYLRRVLTRCLSPIPYDSSYGLLFIFLRLIGIDIAFGPPANRFQDFGELEPAARCSNTPIGGVIEEIASDFNGIAGSNFRIPLGKHRPFRRQRFSPDKFVANCYPAVPL